MAIETTPDAAPQRELQREHDREIDTIDNTFRNQQLHRYVSQMQSEVGQTGKTLHQVFSEYLKLKDENLELARKIENLDIPNCELVTADLFKDQTEILKKFRRAHAQIQQGREDLSDHPWFGFGHPDLSPEDFDAFLRSVRFVAIQLNKFWIEVQSFPLFLNAANTSSVQDIEDVFKWLVSNAPWGDKVQQPRVIPSLANPVARNRLAGFVQTIRSLRSLVEKISGMITGISLSVYGLEEEVELAAEGKAIIESRKLAESTRSELDHRIGESRTRLDRILEVQRFFLQLNRAPAGFPLAQRPREARQALAVGRAMRRIPEGILQWRRPEILAASAAVRIQAWRDRTKPVLEARKKLEKHFRMSEVQDAGELRELASALSERRTFRAFRRRYREAVKAYRALLNWEFVSKKALRETPFQKSERLLEWASFLEQVQHIHENTEMQKLLGPHFQGLDTDLVKACEANGWAAQMKAEVTGQTTSLDEELVSFLFEAPEASWAQVAALMSEQEVERILVLLSEAEFAGTDRDFEDLRADEERQLADINRVREIVDQLKARHELPLKVLETLHSMLTEASQLSVQLEGDIELKTWLKGVYRGIDTDLSLLEEGLIYVQFIENAQIPDGLKAILLSAYGPQRFDENRALVPAALSSLSAVKESLSKLETAYHLYGQAHGLANGVGQVSEKELDQALESGRTRRHVLLNCPIPQLLGRIHRALKNPELFGDWIEFLQNGREVGALGLAPLLEFLRAEGLAHEQLSVIYELGLYASLLRRVIYQTEEGSAATHPGLGSADENLVHYTAHRVL